MRDLFIFNSPIFVKGSYAVSWLYTANAKPTFMQILANFNEIFFSTRTATSCPAYWFPIVYWIVLVLSIMGSIYSANELARLVYGNRKQLTMWRQRRYYVLSNSVLRKCRLVGALLMLSVWLLLLYAIVNVSPAHMTPWLTIKLLVLGLEFIYWLLEVLFGSNKLDASATLSFLLPFHCSGCAHMSR
uniref:Uncharacterized protein n=1 Tax=Glossina brevipalpis TaxID=37001 RepID=A0A1A9W592_9MUSC